MSEPKFKAGDKICWNSGGGGIMREKTGEVLGVLVADELPNVGFKRIMPKGTSMPRPSSFKSGFGGWGDHYLVRVYAPSKPGVTPSVRRAVAYYAPLVRVIDGTSAGAGRLVPR